MWDDHQTVRVDPLTALAVVELAYQAGIPKPLLPVVISEQAAEFGQVLSMDPRIKKISFTGSTRVGKILMKQASETVKAVSMELGGNAPFIVLRMLIWNQLLMGLSRPSSVMQGKRACVQTVYMYIKMSKSALWKSARENDGAKCWEWLGVWCDSWASDHHGF